MEFRGRGVLCDGDLLSIDIGTTLDGYVSDSAVTIPIGNISQTAQRLLEVTRECLTVAIAQMKRGRRLGDIGAAVQAHAEAQGFGVVRELVGHGVGRAMHERASSFPTTASPGPDWSCEPAWSWPSSR